MPAAGRPTSGRLVHRMFTLSAGPAVAGWSMATTDEARVLHQVSARLHSRFPQAEPDRLRRAVESAYHELDGARVRDFVEILVEREAADTLSRGSA